MHHYNLRCCFDVIVASVHYTMLFLCSLAFFLFVISVDSAAFILPSRRIDTSTTTSCRALPSPEESAKALTDYMAKAHEEKLKAMTVIEQKYQDRIRELEEQVKQLEERSPVQTSSHSYEMPATNKALAEKVNEYRSFLTTYLINSHMEKVEAVATAEAKLRDYYTSIIAELVESKEEAPAPSTSTQQASEPSELAGKGGFQ